MSTYYGEFLLSKVIEQNDYTALAKYAITEQDFVTQAEKDVFNFIEKYGTENRGHVPDYRTVVAQCPEFNFRPQVEDSYEFLAQQLKSYVTQIRIQNFMQTKAMKQFEEKSGLDFIDYMVDELTYLKQQADYRTKIGTDLVLDSNTFLAEYEKRKKGESFKVWKSAFPSMPNYLSGNMYTWYGRSGRGKSIFVSAVEACYSAMQGATVLIWAMEMAKFEILSRMYSYISAQEKVTTSIQNGEEMLSGFNTNDFLKGDMNDIDEEKFKDFLRNLNQVIPGKIIIRAVDDMDFYKRGCKQLEGDILQTKADVVVVDPIYYMDYEKNSSNVAGGDVANTSKKIRHIAGHTQAVIHVITQAEEVKDDRDEDGNRELRVPTRAEIKKTKAVLEDATNTFGIDTCDGQFRIELGKGRNGGEGNVIEGIFLPAVGLVYEPQLNEFANLAESYGF